MLKMTGAQYEKKVNEYLRNHLDHLVIRRLRTNQPLTDADLKGLESTLVRSARRRGNAVFRASRPQRVAIARSFREEPSGVGSNGCAGRVLGFSGRQEPHAPPNRFIEMVIDQLSARGVMEASALYEPPFCYLHAEGRTRSLTARWR